MVSDAFVIDRVLFVKYSPSPVQALKRQWLLLERPLPEWRWRKFLAFYGEKDESVVYLDGKTPRHFLKTDNQLKYSSLGNPPQENASFYSHRWTQKGVAAPASECLKKDRGTIARYPFLERRPIQRLKKRPFPLMGNGLYIFIAICITGCVRLTGQPSLGLLPQLHLLCCHVYLLHDPWPVEDFWYSALRR